MIKTYKRHSQLIDDILALANRAKISFPNYYVIIGEEFWNIGGIEFKPIINNPGYQIVICDYNGEQFADYRFEADAKVNLREILSKK